MKTVQDLIDELNKIKDKNKLIADDFGMSSGPVVPFDCWIDEGEQVVSIKFEHYK